MPFIYNGKKYRSYKHPILEYIFERKTQGLSTLPDEIIFSYEDIYQAEDALGIRRDKRASVSNFTIDLTRRATSHESRVPDSIWDNGYDLDRVSDREARQNVAGRLVRKELKPKEPWIVWPEIGAENTIIIPNRVPAQVQPYLGKDEGALLSVMDYCDVLSLALHNQSGTVKRVQHPKKWQPGEVDGLYFSDFEERPILYPVEAKALSTGDNVNLAQIQGAYKTIVNKIGNVEIIPLAIQMIPEGMYLAIFETSDEHSNELIITRYLKVELAPPLEAWRSRKIRKK
jgi:hypothetical protein